MANKVRIDYANKRIVMDREFAKRSAIVGSEEFLMLQTALETFPKFKLVRHEIKKTPKESYKGLNSEYIRVYVEANGSDEQKTKYEELVALSKCHSIRFPKIKSWFLKAFPEIKEYNKSDRKEAA